MKIILRTKSSPALKLLLESDPSKPFTKREKAYTEKNLAEILNI